MSASGYSGAARLSIVWAVTLAILTLMEWRQLDRDPLNRQILSPFIERSVTVHVGHASMALDEFESGSKEGNDQGANTRYEVDFGFNGPLFLICFFGPVIIFHALAKLIERVRKN